jgi:MFS family permease
MSKSSSAALPASKPSPARFGVLGFVCVLSMITYLDRVCFGSVGPFIQAEFGLSNTQLGLLFTAFALSYAAFEVPSGWLGDIIGPRRSLIRIVLWWSLFTALTGAIYPMVTMPLLAFSMLLAVRFLFGVGEAGAYPNITRALHNWFPFTERGVAQGSVWMAGRFGGGITPLVVLALIYYTPLVSEPRALPTGVTAAVGTGTAPAGALAAAPVVGHTLFGEAVHWRHMFWIFGGLGVAWCVFFWFWFRDHPPRTDSTTRDGPAKGEPNGTAPEVAEHSHGNVPWGRLLRSSNLWFLCLMYFCAAYGWYFNITWLPKYLRNEYHVSEHTHGFWTMSLMSGLPLLFGSMACLVGGFLTDRFIYRTGNRKWGRRLFGIIGHSTCAICYFLSITAGSPWLFVLFVALASFCNDLTMGAAWASCQDIGRQYTGIVSGCMNTVGNLGGAAAGYLTGLVLEGGDWTFALGSSGGIHVTAWTVNFLIFGSVYIIAVGFWMLFDATRPVVD